MEGNKGDIRGFWDHSSIKANVSIVIKGVSDRNNILNIAMDTIIPEYREDINRLSEKYPHLKIPRHPNNIPRANLTPPPPKSGGTPHKGDKGKEVSSPSKPPINGIDISYFKRNHLSECSLLMVAQMYNNGKLIEPAIITSRIKALSFFEHIIFPILFSDLSLDAAISVTIYDMNKLPEKSLVGGTCINLFNNQMCLRQGNFSLYVYKDKQGDPTLFSATPGLIDDPLIIEKNNIYSYIDKNGSKEVSSIPWLDALAYQTISKKLEKIDHDANFGALDVRVPIFDLPVVWKEQKCAKKDLFMSCSKFEKKMSASTTKPSIEKSADHSGSKITIVYDPAVMSRRREEFLNQSNPIAAKYYTLSRFVDEAVAKELRPGPDEMVEIEDVLAKPDFNKLHDRETTLIWRYRYYLQSRKDAIIKLLMSVKWEAEKEEKEVLKLLNLWAPIDLEQAIMMVSSLFSLNPLYGKKTVRSAKATSIIREKGIDFLLHLKDDEFDSVLLQIVQAYRYEDKARSPLKKLLFMRASHSKKIASSLMWYIKVEIENKTNGEMLAHYENLYKELLSTLDTPEFIEIRKALIAQEELRNILLEINLRIKANKEKADEKVQTLRKLLAKGGKKDLTKFDPIPLPVNPNIEVNGILCDKCSVFRSKTYPMKITFRVAKESSLQTKEDPPSYSVIFKEGDDLRQDQLVLQIFALMDELLKKVNVDLNFCIYRVVASGIKDGFSEFVTESTTIFDIKNEFPTALEGYLLAMEKKAGIPYEKLLDTYVKSCAGYCAVTYLLGIGDRHLENLMMRRNGQFFHIDFGFILGNDPKFFPSQIRICQEMIDVMGGKASEGFKIFASKCVDAFLYLRKHCQLIVNLFFLMQDAGIKDLKSDGGSSMLTKLYDRFMPAMDEQEAEMAFFQLLQDSISPFFTGMMEVFHAIAANRK